MFWFYIFGLISCLIVFSIAPMFDRKPTSVGTAGSGKFELKNECYKEFNPYFYHYCRTDQSQVRKHAVFWDNSFLTKNRKLFDAHFNRFQCWFKYQPNVLFLSFYRQKRHKSREKKRKNLQTIVSVTYMEWKSQQILLCLIGKCLKAHFILLGEGGGVATFTVFDQNHCILY